MGSNKKKDKLSKKDLTEALFFYSKALSVEIKFFYFISFIFMINLFIVYVIFFINFFELNPNSFIPILLGILTIIVLIIYFIFFIFKISYKLIPDIFLLLEDPLDSIKKLIEYFDKKGTRRDKKEIEFYLNSIERAKTNFSKYLLLNIFNEASVIFFIFFSSLFIFILFDQNYFTILEVVLLFIILLVYIYYFMNFGIRYRDIKNLEKCRKFIEINYYHKLDMILEQIGIIIFQKTNQLEIDISNLLNHLNDWYELYSCNYYNNVDLNILLLEFKDFFTDIQEQESYLMFLFHLKTKINDYHYRTKKIGNLSKEESEFIKINGILQNYIDLLEYLFFNLHYYNFYHIRKSII